MAWHSRPWSRRASASSGSGSTPISRVQGNVRGSGTGSSLSLTFAGTPVNGNVIVCVVATGHDGIPYRTVSSIVQTNVTWARQRQYEVNAGGIYTVVEIWYGVVGAAAGVGITVTLSGACDGGCAADACEYTGMLTVGFLDLGADNTGASAAADTGTTGVTGQAKELWIGGTVSASTLGATQSLPTNGFNLLDGAGATWISLAYLEKIVAAAGTANSGTTISRNCNWIGSICTFKGS